MMKISLFASHLCCVTVIFLVIGLKYCESIDQKIGNNYAVQPEELVIFIRNGYYKDSQEKAESMKKKLLQQSNDISQIPVHIIMLHEEDFAYGRAAWTLLSIFPKILKSIGKNKKWIFFCEETTEINLKGVLEVLSKFDHSKHQFVGHALFDTEPSIIHHFMFHQDPSSFHYPDLDAGWAISHKLLENSVKRLIADPPSSSFSIDVKHEVALFIYNEGKGTQLTNIPEFCINKQLGEDSCVSTVNYQEPNCGSVDPDDILIAVKTCKKFHGDRVPIVKKTVGLDAKHIRYYSDVKDDAIPTEFIGVNNTERGHCQKLHEIIKKGRSQEWKHIKWLVVIDDDTIMSYNRLRKLLACYDSNELVMLGERYGYGVNFLNNGYDYPTGGGGMVLSRAIIDNIVLSGYKCWTHDSPDDMWLGSLSRKIGVPMVNTNSFHQTRPSQYNKELLSHQYLVSFHKHTNVDPLEVYRTYLRDDKPEETKKTEL